jgi:CxxC-x17-CxxC domain-containing protein
MADYNRDRSGGGRGGDRGGRGFGGGRDSGRPSFGGRRGGNDRGGREDRPQMYKAICAECGDNCEVPFRPSGERPVLCRDCFGGNDRKGPRNDSFRDRDNRGSRDNRDNRDGRDNRRELPVDDFSKERFEMLNAKLDKILKLITPVFSVSKEKQAEVEESLEVTKDELTENTEKPKVKKAAKKSKKD